MRRRIARPGALTAALVAILVPAVHGATPPAGAADPVVAVTDHGLVRGTVTGARRDFSGIPYAAPPIGDRRWTAPVPPRPWTGVRGAAEPGPACAQLELPPYAASGSEDCLYLNVTTPRRAAGRGLPVMVWFHGGGFSSGAGGDTRATGLAARGDVMVVTVNYRLGVFGFLAHPALDGGTADRRSGNFGLEDQQAALRWVRGNAAAFGGDPHNVTIFGQWSGGKAVCLQMAAPRAAGLFERAITMSNPCLLHTVPNADGTPDPTPLGMPRPRAEAEGQGLALARDVGCADPGTAASCLRSRPVALLLDRAPALEYTPVYGGGGVLPVDPLKAFEAGDIARVPLMVGINRDAYRTSDAFLEEFGSAPLTEEGYRRRLRAFAGADGAGKVLNRYPLKDYGGVPSLAWSAAATDALLARPMLDTVRLLSPRLRVYAYEFADENAPWYTDVAKPSFPTGSFQDSELQYLFDTRYFRGRVLAPAQRRLSEQMIGYWTRFARTGDPNRPGLPPWPLGDAASDRAQVLAPGPAGVHPADLAQAHHYRFWLSVRY
ncbi:carboxylesterase/lipase family protein [Actinomadura fibrosa]|uniref:Carboxylesterase/lipase family protein n=1 Tax=Actinomadura fibrosa TaxID=111802 RepID=A0ABW2Y327_9ACTN|nr:carboxylesterase family protein [Actinomadura fibrosa]